MIYISPFQSKNTIRYAARCNQNNFRIDFWDPWPYKRNMRYIWITILAFTMSAVADTQFLPLPQDFPIMDGLRIEKSNETIFSNLQGRVMIYVAETQEPVEKVETFYRTTLKNLGWKPHPKTANAFTRHLEEVDLKFETVGINTQVTFTFKPCS